MYFYSLIPTQKSIPQIEESTRLWAWSLQGVCFCVEHIVIETDEIWLAENKVEVLQGLSGPT